MDSSNRKIDTCMKNIIDFMKAKGGKIQPVACCCGHRKYPMTIIVTNGKIFWDLVSNKIIPRKKKFYKKDDGGFYYIPETLEKKKW